MIIIASVIITSSRFSEDVISDKYYLFYLLMELIAFLSFFFIIIKRIKIHFAAIDVLILIFAFIVILHQSNEVATKHILLTLILILYYYLRLAFQENRHIKYWLTVCFIMTGLVESILQIASLLLTITC